MTYSTNIIRLLDKVEPPIKEVLIAILEEIERQRRQWEESVTKTEFNELKEIVKELTKKINELAEAQKRTEQRVNELAEAQKKTEQRLNELAEAQKKTEQRLNELAEAQKKTEQEIAKLTRGLEITRQQVGGLARSVSYALENEAYRYLPKFLKVRYGIEVIDRLIRTFIRDREINIFGRVRRNGKEMYLVGDAVLKLDDISKLRQIWDQVGAVKEEFGGEVIPIIITHFAKPDVLAQAQKAGILVVQSFEWI